MAAMAKASSASLRRSKLGRDIVVNGVLALICIIWLVPLLGLLVSSFRERSDIVSSGWWTVFPHQEYVSVDKIQLTRGIALDQPVQVGRRNADRRPAARGLRAARRPALSGPTAAPAPWMCQSQQWNANTNFTIGNYRNVLLGQEFNVIQPDGSTKVEKGEDMSKAFLNSLTVTIPATVIPILLATFAAYAFAGLCAPRPQACCLRWWLACW